MSECTSTIIQLLKQVQYCTVVQLMTAVFASKLLVKYFQLYRCPNSGKVFDHITSSEKQSQGISSDLRYIHLLM